MVLSYTDIQGYYSDSSFSTHAYNSLNDISLLGQTPPKVSVDNRFSRPTFILDRYVSDSESDDEDMLDPETLLFDLPMELFLNCILPQMGTEDLIRFRATCTRAQALVEMSQNWDARYEHDFADRVPLPGSGFLRYARRAAANCMVSGAVAKGSKLQHAALDKSFDQDILQMRTNHHNNKTWIAPFMPMRSTVRPTNTIASSDLMLASDGCIYQVTSEGEHLLESEFNHQITQLSASLAINAAGETYRIKFDEHSDKRELKLERLTLPSIAQVISIKTCNYGLVDGVGLISWLNSDELEGEVDYAVILASSDLKFSSFDVYEHNYGTLANVALSTTSGVYTLQFDRSGSKAGMRNELSNCSFTEIAASKVVYYEEGVFLALCPNDYVYRLKAGSATPVASLHNIVDLVVSKQGFCMALDSCGKVYSWDLRTRRDISTWAIGSIIKGTRVPIANPLVAKIDGHVVKISCSDQFAFALVA